MLFIVWENLKEAPFVLEIIDFDVRRGGGVASRVQRNQIANNQGKFHQKSPNEMQCAPDFSGSETPPLRDQKRFWDNRRYFEFDKFLFEQV